MTLQHGTRSSFQSVSPDVSSHLTQPSGPCASMPPCRWPAGPGGHAISSRILRLVADAAPRSAVPRCCPRSPKHAPGIQGSRDPSPQNPPPLSQRCRAFSISQTFSRRHETLPLAGRPHARCSTWRLRLCKCRLVPLPFLFSSRVPCPQRDGSLRFHSGRLPPTQTPHTEPVSSFYTVHSTQVTKSSTLRLV